MFTGDSVEEVDSLLVPEIVPVTDADAESEADSAVEFVTVPVLAEPALEEALVPPSTDEISDDFCLVVVDTIVCAESPDTVTASGLAESVSEIMFETRSEDSDTLVELSGEPVINEVTGISNVAVLAFGLNIDVELFITFGEDRDDDISADSRGVA